MKEKEKTKKQLLDELADMHKKVNELETSVVQHEQGGSATRGEELFKTERKRADKKLNEANAQLQMLQQITASVHSTLDLEEVFRQITDGFVYSMGFTTSFIVKLNDQKTHFEVKALSSKQGILHQVGKILGFSLRNYSFPVDTELNDTIRTVMKGEVVVAKTAAEIAYPLIRKETCSILQKLGGIQNYIVVPLQVDREVVGGVVITCTREEVSEEEFKMVKIFAEAASHAIHNANLHTQTQRAEAALRESEQRLKIILRGSPISAYILDKEHKVIHWNKALEELSGMKAEKVIGTKEHWKAFYREERPCLADLLIGERIEEVPQWYPEKSKKSKWVEGAYEATDFFPALGEGGRWMQFTAATIRDSLGKIVGVIETLEDITELKQAENRLRESESRFRNLVENSLTGIYIMQGGQIVYKNSEQDRIFGTLPQPENFNHFKNVHPEDAEKVKEFYEKIMSGEIRNFDIDMRFFPSGEMDDTADMKCIHSLASVIEYQGRKAILINMMDVTRARELEHLVRIDDKMTSLGRAAAGIIHEVRNPLSGINVYLTALRKIFSPPEHFRPETLEKVEEIVGKMESASNKIESVIKRVMDFSKPSIPKLILTNINQAIQESINLSSATLRKYGIRIETSLRDDLPQCFTDSHLIEQVLLNLIMNAAQAMENTAGEKMIQITSAREENLILIRVADSGPGVPPMLRKKIFDPFFTTKKDSSGIGLSVCYRIIADHGGSLDVVTSQWGGAEFRVEIPIEKRKIMT
jgi:PAS domain S-box-containing protein